MRTESLKTGLRLAKLQKKIAEEDGLLDDRSFGLPELDLERLGKRDDLYLGLFHIRGYSQATLIRTRRRQDRSRVR